MRPGINAAASCCCSGIVARPEDNAEKHHKLLGFVSE